MEADDNGQVLSWLLYYERDLVILVKEGLDKVYLVYDFLMIPTSLHVPNCMMRLLSLPTTPQI